MVTLDCDKCLRKEQNSVVQRILGQLHGDHVEAAARQNLCMSLYPPTHAYVFF